ncbi:MAG: carboxypeptidase regulatory-like domain-containing protein [Methanocella sp.]
MKILRFLPFALLVLLLLPCITYTALADSSVTVSVRDGKGPVGGAMVAVQSGGTTYSDQTNSNGLASFSLPDGQYTFTASKAGYSQGSGIANVGTDSTVNITLSNLYTISGTVIDASLGTPLKGASVTVMDKSSQAVYTGSTNDNGIFGILVPNGYYGVEARSGGYESSCMDSNGAGYHVLDNPLYIGYIPVATSSAAGGLNGVRLSTDFPGKTVKVNESVSFDVKITNNGIVDRTYTIAVKEAPPGWNVQLLSGSDIVNRVFVASKSSQTIKVKMTPTDAGSNSVTVMAGSANDTGELKLFVDSVRDTDYRIELIVPDDVSLSTGENRNVEAIIRNNGTSKLTNVMLDIGQGDMPQSLTATVNTRTVEVLNPGESQRFVIQLYAKADAGNGNDKLYMRATSSEAKSDQQYMTVSYATSNTWLGAGIGIALVAILAFGFIVWKYGRR